MPAERLAAWCFEVESWEEGALRDALAEQAGIEVSFLPGEPAAYLERDAHREQLRHVPAICISYARIDRPLLEALPTLELISTRGAGVDHIDLGACGEIGVSVANVPSYGERSVAEHAFTLLLALARRLPLAERRGRTGELGLDGTCGIELRGKTLGVVGSGKIGTAMIELARGFEMEVLAHDRFPDHAKARRLEFEYVSLAELLESSDAISLHTPAAATEGHLIGAAELELVRPGALLVNTARGSLVATGPLLEALADDRLGGAALDVLENERALRDGAPAGAVSTAYRGLLDEGRLLITPHCAFHTAEAVDRLAAGAMQNLGAWARGEPLRLMDK